MLNGRYNIKRKSTGKKTTFLGVLYRKYLSFIKLLAIFVKACSTEKKLFAHIAKLLEETLFTQAA